MTRWLGVGAVALAVSTLVLAFELGLFGRGAVAAEGSRVSFETRPIPTFRLGDAEAVTFGQLTFVGGFEIDPSRRAVGGLSGMEIAADGGEFLAITDDGLMLRSRVLRDPSGRPIGWADGVLKPIRTDRGRLLEGKGDADTEAIDFEDTDDGKVAYISFEGAARIMRGPVETDGFVGPLRFVDTPDDFRRVKRTKGIEALAVAPAGHTLAGRIVAISEQAPFRATSADKKGWVLGENGYTFTVAAHDEFDVTDARFGPDGDLYLLERAFSLSKGVRAQLRRIEAASVQADARVDGEVLFSASLAEQIDNMEGMDFWTDDEGRTRLSMISDDNRSFLQRTLYLEFLLTP